MPRSTGAWWRRRSQSDTPTTPPAPPEASTSSRTMPNQTGMAWGLTMASRGTARAAKTCTWPPVPPCPSSGTLRAQIYHEPSEQTIGSVHNQSICQGQMLQGSHLIGAEVTGKHDDTVLVQLVLTHSG